MPTTRSQAKSQGTLFIHKSRSSKIQKARKKRNVPFRFLNLPAELRNQIYGYAFQGQEHSEDNPHRRWAPSQGKARFPHITITCPREININLLLCCKQIYAEAQSLPFELNYFILTLEDLDDDAYTLAPPTNFSRLKYVDLEVDITSNNSEEAARSVEATVAYIHAHSNLLTSPSIVNFDLRVWTPEKALSAERKCYYEKLARSVNLSTLKPYKLIFVSYEPGANWLGEDCGWCERKGLIV